MVTAADRLAAAHKALRVDSSIQFQLQEAAPPLKAPKWFHDFSEWLGHVFRPIGRFFNWISSFLPDAPYARILLWTVLALSAAALLWAIWQRLRYGRWRWPRLRRLSIAPVAVEEEDWALAEAPVHHWLEEADTMAAEGHYAEAVHHLLFRSIEDIARRRPQLIRPALTSRELSVAEVLPDAARKLFASIAKLVERSLFGGRPVDANDWSSARTAYADLALPKSWRQ